MLFPYMQGKFTLGLVTLMGGEPTFLKKPHLLLSKAEKGGSLMVMGWVGCSLHWATVSEYLNSFKVILALHSGKLSLLLSQPPALNSLSKPYCV